MAWTQLPKRFDNGPLSQTVGVYINHQRHLTVILTKDADLWHLSIAHPKRYPTWDEIYEARYHFIPDNVYMMMGLPPKSVYVNRHPNCFHLWEAQELKTKWIMDQG